MNVLKNGKLMHIANFFVTGIVIETILIENERLLKLTCEIKL